MSDDEICTLQPVGRKLNEKDLRHILALARVFKGVTVYMVSCEVLFLVAGCDSKYKLVKDGNIEEFEGFEDFRKRLERVYADECCSVLLR